MNIILLGPPGAGKGTQADNIVKDYNLHKVSSGDLLRKEIRNNILSGKKIKSIIDSVNEQSLKNLSVEELENFHTEVKKIIK